MSVVAKIHKFTGPTVTYPSYDSTKTTLGRFITQKTGATNLDKWAGPFPLAIARPMEASVSISSQMPTVYTWDSTTDWVFVADLATAAASRRIVLFEFNKSTVQYTYKGFITNIFPAVTNHTIRGHRPLINNYTAGTAAVSGTAVTGTSTLWDASRLSVGCRIGFGTTDPTAVGTWYEIGAINDDTSITLTSSAGTIVDGPYVIQDFTYAIVTTNATTTNGGLFITKGLRPELFISTGTTIAAATTTDRIRAVYWLADAATVTNTVAAGCAREPMADWQTQHLYVNNGTTSVICYKYNARAALSDLSAGKSALGLVFATGTQAVTGTNSQADNGNIGTAAHGPGSGVQSLYFVTTTRVYRAALSNITSGSTTWQSDVMTEVPAGGTSHYAAGAILSTLDYSEELDRFVITCAGTADVRSYVTRYNTTGDQFDHMFLVGDKQLDHGNAPPGTAIHPSIGAVLSQVWVANGFIHWLRASTGSTINQIYAMSLAAHWEFTGGVDHKRLISPSISTVGATKFYNIFVNEINMLGSANLGTPPEPYRVLYRTSDISDNSGAWTLLDDSKDLSLVTPTSAIQFAFEFRILGHMCIPSRIMSFAITYEDDNTDSHYIPSVTFSDTSARRFAYRQDTSWGSDIPDLRIRLYNLSSGLLILDDTVLTSASGTWEYSDDNGSTWDPWDATQDSIGNYIRYTANSLPGSISVRALLTQV